jgi:peptide/nickel transport system substrate-binding protein
MRTLKRRTFLLGSAAAVGLGTTACGGGGRSRSGPVGEPRPGGTRVLQMPSEISTHIHPLLQTDPAAMGVVSGTVYSKLLEFRTGPDVTTLEIEPDLAESWEVSPDGLTYTFRLRGDVRWHNVPPVNGRPFTSDDVVATFEAIKQTPAQYAWMYEPVSSVTAPDERTVVFTLDRPYTPLLEYLAYHFSMIVPREGL